VCSKGTSTTKKKTSAQNDGIQTFIQEIPGGSVVRMRQFYLLSRGISSGFPSAGHFDLPGSQAVFGASQDSPGCAHSS